MNKELQKLLNELEKHPEDARLLSKVAELQQRDGATAEAVQTLMRLARAYEIGGFRQRASAVLKQVRKLDPKHVAAREELARTYELLGLFADAVEEHRELIRVSNLAGDADAAGRARAAVARLADSAKRS